MNLENLNVQEMTLKQTEILNGGCSYCESSGGCIDGYDSWSELTPSAGNELIGFVCTIAAACTTGLVALAFGFAGLFSSVGGGGSQ